MPKRSKLSKAMKPSAKQIAKNVFKTSANEFRQGFTAFARDTKKSMKNAYRSGQTAGLSNYKKGKKVGKRLINKIFKNK